MDFPQLKPMGAPMAHRRACAGGSEVLFPTNGVFFGKSLLMFRKPKMKFFTLKIQMISHRKWRQLSGTVRST